MFKAAFWSSFDRILFQAVNLVIAIVIARYLGPEQLGIIAIVTGYVYFLNMFVDSGLTISIIRNKNISDEEISSIFYFNFAISTIFVFLTLISSNLIESYFHIRNLGFYLNISSIILVFNSFAFVRYAKLEQNMEFKLLTLINLFSIIISGTICLLMLSFGFGIFAVVLFGIFSSLIRNISYIILTPSFKLYTFNLSVFKPHFKFGKNLLFSSTIETIYTNGFPILITKLFSGFDAGIFFQSKKLIDGPTTLISSASRRFFLPYASKFNNDSLKTYALLLQILKTVNFICILLLGLLFINADYIILKLMGPKWFESIIILKILIIGMAFYPAFFLCLDVFKIQGLSKRYSRTLVISRLLSIIIIIPSSFFGFTFMVWCFSITQFIMFIFVAYQLKNSYDYSVIKIFKTISPFLTIALPVLLILEIVEIKTDFVFILLCLKSLFFCISYFFFNSVIFKYNPLKSVLSKIKNTRSH